MSLVPEGSFHVLTVQINYIGYDLLVNRIVFFELPHQFFAFVDLVTRRFDALPLKRVLFEEADSLHLIRSHIHRGQES